MPEDREWRTLQILEEHSKGIERTKLIEKMRSKFDLSHVPVENLIKKLMDMKKIDAWTYKPKARKKKNSVFPSKCGSALCKAARNFFEQNQNNKRKVKVNRERF